MKIILASASPRRRQLLEMLGVSDLSVIPSCKEEPECGHLPPGQAVLTLSREKALDVASGPGGQGVVIGADTIVYVDGRILGKPSDEGQAASMLRLLSGRGHKVFTGVTVIARGESLSEYEETDVFFRKLSGEEIAAYIKTGEPMDKAGAYGAQGIGSLFVRGIEGDFFNVMGLPLCRLGGMLKRLGVSLL